MRFIGLLLILFGAIDFVGSLFGFDLWGELGVDLPFLVWSLSAYLEIALGGLLIRLSDEL